MDYELIPIAEIMSIVCFLIARPKHLRGILACYVGDNRNVVTWIRLRRPGHRVDKYLVRILNRLENDFEFPISPMNITTHRNKVRCDLSRLTRSDVIKFGAVRGYAYVDLVDIAK